MTVNGREYETLKLLGKGKGGYSYLVTDGARKLVLKQIHHEPCDYYRFGDKLASGLRDYARLREVGIRMPQLLSWILSFSIAFCITFPYNIGKKEGADGK